MSAKNSLSAAAFRKELYSRCLAYQPRQGFFSVVAFELEEIGAPHSLDGSYTPGQQLGAELETLLRGFCRGSDVYCRESGACRFLILLNAANREGAHIAAKRMLCRLQQFLARRLGEARAAEIVCRAGIVDVTELEGDTETSQASSTLLERVARRVAEQKVYPGMAEPASAPEIVAIVEDAIAA